MSTSAGQRHHAPSIQQYPPSQGAAQADIFHHEDGEDDGDDDDETPVKGKGSEKKAGRRKIKIEFINDKSRRHITFSKRKAGIMKKAYELSTLTGTQVLLLVVSETGLVYTFTTSKLQPLVTQPEGKNLIQACLNSPSNQAPTGAPLGVPSTSVHQASLHPPPHLNIPVTGPPQLPMPAQRNVPGGLSIEDPDRNRRDDDDDDEDDDSGPAGDGGSEPPTPPSAITQHAQPLPPQHHASHHGPPSHSRAGGNPPHSSHGAHHGTHPYSRDPHQTHRRKASSGPGHSVSNGPGKITSPRLALRTPNPVDASPDGHMNSPTLQGHPHHDPSAMYTGYPAQGPSPDGPNPQARMMYHQPYPGMPSWGVPPGAAPPRR